MPGSSGSLGGPRGGSWSCWSGGRTNWQRAVDAGPRRSILRPLLRRSPSMRATNGALRGRVSAIRSRDCRSGRRADRRDGRRVRIGVGRDVRWIERGDFHAALSGSAELGRELTDRLALVEGAELGMQDCFGARPPFAYRGRLSDRRLDFWRCVCGRCVLARSRDILRVFLPCCVVKLEITFRKAAVADRAVIPLALRANKSRQEFISAPRPRSRRRDGRTRTASPAEERVRRVCPLDILLLLNDRSQRADRVDVALFGKGLHDRRIVRRSVRVHRHAAGKRLRLGKQHLVLLIAKVVRLRPLLTLLRLLVIADEISERVPDEGAIVERGIIGRRDGFPGH